MTTTSIQTVILTAALATAGCASMPSGIGKSAASTAAQEGGSLLLSHLLGGGGGGGDLSQLARQAASSEGETQLARIPSR
jgi:hypothetical protein